MTFTSISEKKRLMHYASFFNVTHYFCYVSCYAAILHSGRVKIDWVGTKLINVSHFYAFEHFFFNFKGGFNFRRKILLMCQSR